LFNNSIRRGNNLKNQKTSVDFGRGGELNTFIGKGTEIQGTLDVQNSLRVDGRITGNIKSTATVVIGKDGIVEGQVRAKHVMLAGRVQGNISSSGRVFLESTSTVLGDIKATKLVVDEGAIFDGKCKMKEGEEKESEDTIKTQ
jgi:cytoskeletal protein CcmA (bactofilin family)